MERGPAGCGLEVEHVERTAVAAADGKAILVAQDDLTGAGMLAPGAVTGTRGPDRDAIAAGICKRARIGVSDRADQPFDLRGRFMPVDPPIIRAAAGCPGRDGFVLRFAGNRAPRQPREQLAEHLVERSHVLGVERPGGFGRSDVEETLGEQGAAVDAVVDPEQARRGDLFVEQDRPGNDGTSAQARQWGGMIAHDASARGGAKFRPTYLRPADDEDDIGGDRLHLLEKGYANWIDLKTPDGVIKDVAWVYNDPKPGYTQIKGRIGFYSTNRAGTTAVKE